MKKKILSVLIVATMICATLPTFAFAKSNVIKVHNSATYQLEKPEVSGDAVWKSSNKKVAKVNKDGVVTGKKAGTCTITAKVGKTTLKYRVKVPTYYENWKNIPDFGALFGLKEYVEEFDEELVEDAISADASIDEDVFDEDLSDEWMLLKTYKANNKKQAKLLCKKYEKRLKSKLKYKINMKIWAGDDNSYANTWKKGDISVTVSRAGKKIEILCMDSAKLEEIIDEEMAETDE